MSLCVKRRQEEERKKKKHMQNSKGMANCIECRICVFKCQYCDRAMKWMYQILCALCNICDEECWLAPLMFPQYQNLACTFWFFGTRKLKRRSKQTKKQTYLNSNSLIFVCCNQERLKGKCSITLCSQNENEFYGIKINMLEVYEYERANEIY